MCIIYLVENSTSILLVLLYKNINGQLMHFHFWNTAKKKILILISETGLCQFWFILTQKTQKDRFQDCFVPFIPSSHFINQHPVLKTQVISWVFPSVTPLCFSSTLITLNSSLLIENINVHKITKISNYSLIFINDTHII